MRKSGLTGDEAYVLSKHGKTTEDLGPLKKEIGKLKEDFENELNASKNGIENLSYTENRYVQKQNGKIKAYKGWCMTEFIKCDSIINVFVPNITSDISYNAFYSNVSEIGTDTFISSFSLTTGENIINVPSGANYFVLSGDSLDLKRIIVQNKNSIKFNMIDARLTKAEQDIEDLKNKEPSIITDVFHADLLALNSIIPAYWKKNNYLINKINSIVDPHFVFCTDYHAPSNTLKSNLLAKYVMFKTGVSYYVGGSDILNVNQTTEEAEMVLKTVANDYDDAFGDRFVYLFGNHDNNTCQKNNTSVTSEPIDRIVPFKSISSTLLKNPKYAYDSYNWIDKIKGTPTEQEVEELKSYTNLHYYIDDENKKTRYIILNTGVPENGVVKTYVGISGLAEIYLQLDWLYDTLKTTPNGYNVFVFAHQVIGEANNAFDVLPSRPSMNPCENIMTMLIGFKNKYANTVCRQYNGTFSLLETIYAKGNHVYDFSMVGDIGAVALFSGHWHMDKIVYATDIASTSGTSLTNLSYDNNYSEKSVPIVFTLCDAIEPYNPSGVTPVEMERDTFTENAFDVVSIDKENRKVKMVRIGAGIDRECFY